MVFTEIDHNYCNPVSSKYQNEIDSIFSDSSKWINKTGNVELYPTLVAIFNEYTTHAVYLLYVRNQFHD